jgi:predicted RNA-binding protein with PIN domain
MTIVAIKKDQKIKFFEMALLKESLEKKIANYSKEYNELIWVAQGDELNQLYYKYLPLRQSVMDLENELERIRQEVGPLVLKEWRKEFKAL